MFLCTQIICFDNIHPLLFSYSLIPFSTVFNVFYYSIFIHGNTVLWVYSHIPITLFFYILPFCWFPKVTVPFLHSFPYFYFALFRSRFCIWKKTSNICLFKSGLFCLTLWSLTPSIFLQTTQFCSLQLNNTLVCVWVGVCVTFSVPFIDWRLYRLIP
jgi:hypothetical protein